MYTIACGASGAAGKSGDGGPATGALLSQSRNATVDAAGNLYIADGADNRVQEVAAANGAQCRATPATGGRASLTASTGAPSAITLKNSTTTLQSFTYTDAPCGNILSEADTPSSAQSPAVYTYDAQGRVTSMTPGTGSAKTYGFDPSGNLTTLPTGGTGTYDNAGELTSQAQSGTTSSYTYNADGQQLSAAQGTAAISQATWNGAGQLAAYDTTAADMSGAAYDGNGLRASTTITPAGGSPVTQDYVWNTIRPAQCPIHSPASRTVRHAQPGWQDGQVARRSPTFTCRTRPG